jgi:Tfp pilus assembly protein PilF
MAASTEGLSRRDFFIDASMLASSSVAPKLLIAAMLLSGVASAASRPFGSAQGPPFGSAQGKQVTFSKDVAPILFEHCTSCHRPGEIGPFSLLSYRDARQRATQIADLTARRVMPPWKPVVPEPGKGEFIGERSLTREQIETIRRWVEQGALEGDAIDSDARGPDRGQGADRWQLGTPDLVVAMDAPYVLRAEAPDVFRTFVIPIPMSEMRYVRAVEFHPGNARAVHHANFGIDRTQSSRRLDLADAEPGYAGGMVPDAGYPPGHMLGWTPGQRPRPSPDGTAWRLDRGSDLVVQLHMQPTGKPEPVQVSAGFFFTDVPPVRTPLGLRLGSQTIDIPAGAANYTIQDSYRLPVDVEVLSIQPHAHNLGRRMEAAATLPDGKTRPLITIADWDFRWQDVYRYSQPIVLPAGSTISMRFTYDNSDANPRNPNRPPQRVVWGQNTTDEMGDLWIQIVPLRNADLTRLSDDIERKKRAEDIAAYTKVLQGDPGNPLRHDAVAMLYLRDGQSGRAEAHFRDSLRLNPDSAPSHYNLGIALSAERRFDEAASEFREALRLDPDHAGAHNNLGAMLHVAGRLDEAAAHYRRAVELRPDNAEAFSNLGRVLSLQQRDADAVASFRRALALNADLASAQSGLGWVLATSSDAAVRQPAEAVRASERAVDLTARTDASALDTLAAAYAAAGDFQRAATTAREALELATRGRLLGLADQIRARLALYERRQPYSAEPLK